MDRRYAGSFAEWVALNVPPEPLSRRQLECLLLSSHGLEAPMIADFTHLSLYTVNTYLTYARRRLAAKTTTHAVATALRQGIIH